MTLPWESVLADMDQAVLEAYVLANIHAVRMCQLGDAVEPLNQVFFYRCLSCVCNANSTLGSPAFQQSVTLYNTWRGEDAQHASNRQITAGWQQNASQMMATNTKNAIVRNFYRRFHRHIKRVYDMNGAEAYVMIKSILDPAYNGNDTEVQAWREQIPRNESGYLSDEANRLLPLTYIILTDIEERNRRFQHRQDIPEVRTFSLLPTKNGFKCSHFKMCKTALHSLLLRAGVRLPPLGDDWNAVADDWWHSLFNIEKFETANEKFAGEIVTDGKTVSIVMWKLHELCRRLTQQAGRRTVVGFGDWSNTENSGLIKKCPAGTVKRLEHTLRNYCRVQSIDEFRTSKLHSRCHRQLEYQYSLCLCKVKNSTDKEWRTCKVYSVLHCRSNGCFGTTVNRDVNASKNMPMLLLNMLRGQPRPNAFCRAPT